MASLDNYNFGIVKRSWKICCIDLYDICDAIEQNESLKFNFYFSDWLYTSSCKVTFNYRPNWSIGSKDTGSWMVSKTIGNKEIICFVRLCLKISICEFQLELLDHITFIKTYHPNMIFSTFPCSPSCQKKKKEKEKKMKFDILILFVCLFVCFFFDKKNSPEEENSQFWNTGYWGSKLNYWWVQIGDLTCLTSCLLCYFQSFYHVGMT